MARTYLLLAMVFSSACGSSPPPQDAGSDRPGECTTNSDCDDGTFCNGAETCEAGSCEAGVEPCGDRMCREEDESCDELCVDADGDGSFDAACGGRDCDDADPERFPGNDEVCDADDHDEDCDPSTFGFRDADGDLFPDAACCNGENCGSDCNDMFPGAHPGEAESCDGFDNDCDGSVDEGVQRTFYPDTDGDLAGDAMAAPVMACDPPEGHVENDDDCDDSDGAIGPLAGEVCEPGCDPGDPAEDCVDENCDGVALSGDECECTIGESEPCCSGRGMRMCEPPGVLGVCTSGSVIEECNTIDDDCDGRVDEGLVITCYVDADDDGYAAAGAASEEACTCAEGFTARAPSSPSNTDCNDEDESVRPGAPEICDRVDSDCSSGGGPAREEDADGDGFAAIGAPCSDTPAGAFPRTDCNDDDGDVHPGADYMPGPTSPSCRNEVDCWDYNCDGVVSRRYTRIVDAMCTGCNTEMRTQFGFATSIACGERAELHRCITAGGGPCTHSSTPNTTQTCR